MLNIKICEVCNNKILSKVLDLGLNPLCDDLLPLGTKKINKSYKIEILFCLKCKTAHQKYQIDKKILFPNSYHYRARLTEDVKNGMKNLVNFTAKKTKTLKNKIVLDIGCNDGTLLNYFNQKGAVTIGIEPTGAAKDANKKHKVYNEYFDHNVCRRILKKFKKIDIITFTNVFAHISKLDTLLKNLKIIMSSNTLLIIENHYLGSVLDKKQFDTFYHEHPRTYSLSSFLYIAKKLNAKILGYDFPSRYGGNIRVLISKNAKKNKNFDLIIKKENKFYFKFKMLSKTIIAWKKKKNQEIKNLNKIYGKLPAKAFPGRAAILLKLLNLSKNEIEAIYEKDKSIKNYNYAPGTKIPILPEKHLFKNIRNTKVIINFAWHIKKEITKYLRSNKFKGKIINIF